MAPSNKVHAISTKNLFFLYGLYRFARVYEDKWIDVKFHVS